MRIMGRSVSLKRFLSLNNLNYSIFCILCLWGQSMTVIAEEMRYVTVDFATIRSSPNLVGKPLGILYYGETVRVTKDDGEWVSIVYEKDKIAYMAGSLLSIKKPSLSEKYQIPEWKRWLLSLTHSEIWRWPEPLLPNDYVQQESFYKNVIQPLNEQIANYRPATSSYFSTLKPAVQAVFSSYDNLSYTRGLQLDNGIEKFLRFLRSGLPAGRADLHMPVVIEPLFPEPGTPPADYGSYYEFAFSERQPHTWLLISTRVTHPVTLQSVVHDDRYCSYTSEGVSIKEEAEVQPSLRFLVALASGAKEITEKINVTEVNCSTWFTATKGFSNFQIESPVDKNLTSLKCVQLDLDKDGQVELFYVFWPGSLTTGKYFFLAGFVALNGKWELIELSIPALAETGC